MIVSKFGGTSVKDSEAIRRLIDTLSGRNGKTLLVVSAMAGVTNSLVSIIQNLQSGNKKAAIEQAYALRDIHRRTCEELNLDFEVEEFINERFVELANIIEAIHILGEETLRSKDYILSFGEILSSRIVAAAFQYAGIHAVHADSRFLIKTDDNHTEAAVDFAATEKAAAKLLPFFDMNDIIVCGGFIASTADGITTTLGRGGSDYSAAVLASALNAEKLEIWTDVDGILTSDPRKIKNAKKLLQLTYEEAAELAYFGAKVLHPKTIYPAIKKKIPVYVLNSYNPSGKGTLIAESAGGGTRGIKAIAFRSGITIINVNSNRMLGAYGFLSKVFEIFNKYETPVDLVTTSEVNISLTIDNKSALAQILKELEEIGDISVVDNNAILSAVGEGVKDTAGLSAKFFGILSGINISMVSIGASDINLSIVIKEEDLQKAAELLHEEFFGGELDAEIFAEIGE